ncbi:hypothetical protein TcCL_NonESM11679 [Trypanosoma cruzi]|nr:hypothetical protein TcCL_NonESM11679 [Trypanosoma cruzi]
MRVRLRVCVVCWSQVFAISLVLQEWAEWRWWRISSPPAWWMAAGVVCHPCMDAVSWCVNCAAGPAAFSSCCLLSLAVSAALRPSPSCSILFLLAHGSADSSDYTTGDDGCDGGDGDGAAPCWSLRSCAAAARPCA